MPEMNIHHHFPSLEEVKTHLQENKKIYVAGGTCLIVGAFCGSLYSRRTVGPSNTISLYFLTSQQKHAL